MAAKPIKKDSPAEAAPPQPSAPLKVLRIDDVSASVFARERTLQGEPVTFYSVSFSRSYKDTGGERRYTKSFDADDLGALASLTQQASEFIRSREDAGVA